MFRFCFIYFYFLVFLVHQAWKSSVNRCVIFGISKWISIVIFILFSSFGFALKKPSFPLKDELKGPLISLLDEAVYLHKAFYSKKEDQIHLTVSKMVSQIKALEQSPQLLPYHQKYYVYRLLQTLKPQLESIQSVPEERSANINSINRTITYMAHIYGLKKYDVFFCPTDRSVWMQGKKIKKARPLHLKYQSCGSPVGK